MIANYESFAVLKLLAAGYKVFIDYLGGGTGFKPASTILGMTTLYSDLCPHYQ